MARLNKKQRRTRRSVKKTEAKKRRLLNQVKIQHKPQPWEPVKMKLFQMSNPFPEDFSHEKRLEILKTVIEKAKNKFEQNFPTIENWFREYDPLYLLSYCSLYFVSHPEGTDPEVSGRLDFPPYFLEIMQAFSLYQLRNNSVKPIYENAQKLHDDMREIGDAMMMRLAKLPSDFSNESNFNAYILRAEMMSSTIAIRNWASYYQIKKIKLDLAKLIDTGFKSLYGVGSQKLIETLLGLIEERTYLLK